MMPSMDGQFDLVKITVYLLLQISASAKLWKPDDLRKSFHERYASNQLTVTDLLKKASQKRWMCDKSNFPGMNKNTHTNKTQ